MALVNCADSQNARNIRHRVFCEYTASIHKARRLSYGFLLWTVQRTCGVQDCLLGVVEELRDVL